MDALNDKYHQVLLTNVANIGNLRLDCLYRKRREDVSWMRGSFQRRSAPETLSGIIDIINLQLF